MRASFGCSAGAAPAQLLEGEVDARTVLRPLPRLAYACINVCRHNIRAARSKMTTEAAVAAMAAMTHTTAVTPTSMDERGGPR